MTQLGTTDSPGNLSDPQSTTEFPRTGDAPTPVVNYASRRSLRNDTEAKTHSVATRKPAASPASRVTSVTRPQSGRKGSPKRLKGGVINIVVMTLAAGLIGTMAIPAYAFNPKTAADSQFGTSAIDGLKKSDAQSVAVAGSVSAAAVTRDPVTATSVAALQEQKAEAARKAAATTLENYAAAYTGPSVSDFLANPPYPSFSLAQVFSVAEQYIGDPYVFGGATPAGFDCSGYVMFVYAQFGISLPHSVSGEAARGTRISIQDAVPGDLIVMPGHIGFYAGNGNIMDAPDSGRSISIRPIWTTDYYVVRLGI